MSSAEQAPAAAATATATQTTEAPSLLDQVIKATRPQSEKEQERAKDYFRQFLDQAVKPGQVVSKDVETNIKYLDRRDRQEALSPAQRDHAPPGPSEARVHLAGPALPGEPDRNEHHAEDPGAQHQEAGTVQGPGKSRRIRPELVVQEDLRAGVRSARRSAVRHAGRRLRIRPQRRGHQPAQDDLRRGRRGARAVRRQRQPQAVQLRQLHRTGQSPRPGQDLRERGIRGLEVVPRIGRLAVHRA